jgi:DNA replication protein DnaC
LDAAVDAPSTRSALSGRAHELEVIDGFLDQASLAGAALVLRGEPGVGKTAFLNAASEAAGAAGMSVLRAEGVEFEADLTFSTLHQTLDPV